jgi:2-keto-4-pentenoate hydratase/2-oxohepta-3-ene-1,7-dioic acid hydratase in catechol pathway
MSTPYHLLSFRDARGTAQAGLLVNGQVYNAASALGCSDSLMAILAEWDAMRPALREAADRAAQGRLTGGVPLASVQLLAPLLYPGAIYCAGANYSDHVAEMAKLHNRAPDPNPKLAGAKSWHFIKPARGTVVGPGATVQRPAGCEKLDWEIELVAVIGKEARNVAVERALEYVAAYTIADDVSARDLSRRAKTPEGSPFYYDWVAHKSFQGACPLGPWITPAEQIGDPQRLSLKLFVNDVLKQDSNTSEMIFNTADQIAHISARVTLYPGDIILTGTPAGVGSARGEFLQPGDRLRLEIEKIGALEHRIG